MSNYGVKNKCILVYLILMMGFIFASCNTKLVYVKKVFVPTKIYELDDKDGITHVYNEKFNEILTYNKSEKLCVAVKNASECCLIEKVDIKEKYKFCIYDTNTKNKKCEFEYEIKFEYEIEDNEEGVYDDYKCCDEIISISNYYVLQIKDKRYNRKYVLVNKETKKIDSVKHDYNNYNTFYDYLIFSGVDQGDCWGGIAIYDKDLNFIKEYEEYQDASYFVYNTVDICGETYLKLEKNHSYPSDKKYGENLLDKNMNLVFPEPFYLSKDNYDKKIIEIHDDKYNVLFDVNKREIISKTEIVNEYKVDDEIKNKINNKSDKEVIKCEYSKNNKSLIVVTFDDKTKHIYDKNLNLIFENIGYIDYLELLGKKLMSKNKKTVIVDSDYNVIKTLDEDYYRFEVFECNNKNILKGTYIIKRSETTIGESRWHILDSEFDVRFKNHFLINETIHDFNLDNQKSLIDKGLFLIGSPVNDKYYKAKYNKYVSWNNYNNLVIYDFDFNIIKKFDKEYYGEYIAPIDLEGNEYYLLDVGAGEGAILNKDFNILIDKISYIDISFSAEGTLICIDKNLYKYSKDLKSRELILKDVKNLDLSNGMFFTYDKHGDYLFLKYNNKCAVLNNKFELVVKDFDVLKYKDDKVIYFENAGEKGFIDYRGNVKVSI